MSFFMMFFLLFMVLPDENLRVQVYQSTKKGNKRGFGQILEYESATFHLDRTHECLDGLRYYWQCSFSTTSCKARIVTKEGLQGHEIVKYTGSDSHCHVVSGSIAAVKRARHDLHSAATSSVEPSSVIVDMIRASVPAPLQALLPKKATLSRNVRRVRQTARDLPVEPQSAIEIEIPPQLLTIFSRDHLGGPDIESDFVVIDTGVASGDDRLSVSICVCKNDVSGH
uniref:FLYWCH-type domain-containing protein n=1 Tax=Panagrolaimus davidi TaxID=227884 RepID=A0A914QHB1_9BILA